MSIAQRLTYIKSQIAASCVKYGRHVDDVQLVAVCKNRTIAEIEETYQAGQLAFAENYAQEAVSKILALKHLPLQWHFIGAIQANKTKLIAGYFDWAHCVSRFEIAKRLSQQRSPQKAPLNVCIQVNISGEASKSGIKPNEVLLLARQLVQLPRLTLRGLMTIPAMTDEFQQQRQVFRQVADLAYELQQAGIAMDTLSMGMSDDHVAAIAEGATLVRIGTAIFKGEK